MITQEMVKQAMDYNPETGIFMWKEPKRGRSFKKPVGCLFKDGYISMNFNNQPIKAHRLAWLYVYGELPRCDIDHINGNRSDNRICNLRKASRRENTVNQEMHRNGKLSGCTWDKKWGKWQAQIRIGGRKYHLGYYLTEQEAHEKYKQIVINIDEFVRSKNLTLKGK